MQRKIKFRAWDKLRKTMCSHEDINIWDRFMKDDMSNQYAPLMQYTGLKDKNGKEIYEGDICNCREFEYYGKVEWNGEQAGYYFCIICEDGMFEEENIYDYIDELEVIGNIYENPELLEEV